jgi:hypothetical protein
MDQKVLWKSLQRFNMCKMRNPIIHGATAFTVLPKQYRGVRCSFGPPRFPASKLIDGELHKVIESSESAAYHSRTVLARS